MTQHPYPEELQLYLEGRLTSPGREALAQHLEQCSRCRLEIERFRELVHGLESLNEVDLPPTFASDMAEAVSARRRITVVPARRSLLLQAAIGCLVLLAGCAMIALTDQPIFDTGSESSGLMDLLLGSPFQMFDGVVGGLALTALLGLGLIFTIMALHQPPKSDYRLPVEPRQRRRR